MSNKIWLIIGALAVIIGGAAVFGIMSANRQQSAAPVANNQATPPASQPQTKGSYVDYDASKNAATQGRKILFFHAPWCPQCRALEKSIKEQGVPSGITIFKVDYDSSSELKQRYGVTLQTTLVEIDQNGNAIKKHVAYNEPSLPAVLAALGQ
jgi:thiol-disulfide isomerase/thioredoxin